MTQTVPSALDAIGKVGPETKVAIVGFGYVGLPLPEPEAEPEAEEEDFEEEEETEELMSQDELDSMFGEDTDPEPIESLADEEAEDEEDDIVDFDDIPDPDPIPESLLSSDDYDDEDDDDEPSGPKRMIIAVVVLLGLFGGLFGGLYFARDKVIEMIPASEGLYKMIGLTEPLGFGLDIRGVRSARGLDGDVDVLNINGVIANVSDAPREVPLIRVSLYNSENEEVQFQMVTPEQEQLAPEETLRFKAMIMDPAATARRLEVTFTETEDGGEAGQ